MKFTEKTLAAPLPEDLQKLKWYGDFPVMERVLKKRLKKDLPSALKERFLAELEIIRRLPGQYPYSWENALNMMMKNIRDFSQEEFQELWEEDAMDWIYIQGKVHFHHLFFSNLIKTREWLCSRLLFPELAEKKKENSEFLNQIIAVMKAEGKISRRFCVQTTLCLKESAKRTNEPIRVYLPLPVEYAQVKDFCLLHAQAEVDKTWQDVPVSCFSPDAQNQQEKFPGKESQNQEEKFPGKESQSQKENFSGKEFQSQEERFLSEESSCEGIHAWIAPEHSPQRTLCFCGKYPKDARFRIEYTYQVEMPYIDLYQENGQKNSQKPLAQGWFPKEDSDFPKHYLKEELPHIRFTPYLRALTEEIVGTEKNPCEKAKKIYDYLTTHMMYSFVRDYFLITELVDYTAAGWKGDCGLQALLFITLCRIAEIPARWQSGLYTRPNDPGSHDWAMFYLEEYGWLFADCSFGGTAARMGCEERRRFYFGNLDPYRMPSCCQFQADFLPPVKGWRFDPYDNQSGEVEYPDRCLYAEETETEHRIWEIE